MDQALIKKFLVNRDKSNIAIGLYVVSFDLKIPGIENPGRHEKFFSIPAHTRKEDKR